MRHNVSYTRKRDPVWSTGEVDPIKVTVYQYTVVLVSVWGKKAFHRSGSGIPPSLSFPYLPTERFKERLSAAALRNVIAIKFFSTFTGIRFQD